MVGGQDHDLAALPPGKGWKWKDAGWVSRPVWTGAENLTPTGLRNPDRPVCSESQHRLRYPGL